MRAPSPYTKERLEAAARGARTLSEALERLEVDPRSSTRKYLRARMAALGVDTSHFEREGVKWSREVLQAAVSASTTVVEVLHHLGLEAVGGHHTHISRKIKTYGIDTSHFQIPSRRGETRRPRTPEALLVEQSAERARRTDSDRLRRALTASGIPERCALCGAVDRCRLRWTTSTATGVTTGSRTSESCARTAIPQRTVTEVAARHCATGAPDE